MWCWCRYLWLFSEGWNVCCSIQSLSFILFCNLLSTEHVFKHPDDESKFYAIFSTSSNGLVGSAICTFSLDAIQETFMGKFKEQATSSSAWLPVLSSKVPEPRPGTCVNDTTSLPDSVLNFIRVHPLMDSSVPTEGGKPVFFKRDTVFTRIAVDYRVTGGQKFIVYFAGTSNGMIYKIVQWYDLRKDSYESNLVDVFEATVPEAVRAIEISAEHRSLYVASDTIIRQFDLYSCKSRHETCVRCIRDPYCGWDRIRGECKPYSSGWVIVPVESSGESVCLSRDCITSHLMKSRVTKSLLSYALFPSFHCPFDETTEWCKM